MFVLGTINETLEPAPSVQGPLKVPIQTMDPQITRLYMVHGEFRFDLETMRVAGPPCSRRSRLVTVQYNN